MKILVTGSNGQLAHSLKKISENSEDTWRFVSREEMDIANEEQIAQIFSAFRPNVCINTAAYTNVEGAEDDAEGAFRINAEGPALLAKACKDHNALLMHISTDYVFDGSAQHPYRPSDPTCPINVYGTSKLQGEERIAEALSEYYIVRTSWLYNPSFGKNFYRTILDKAKQGVPLKVTDAQTGCPTNTDHLAQYLMDFLRERPPYGVYHFSDDEVMTWYDFARRILEENGLSNATTLERTGAFPTKAARPSYSVMETTRFTNL